MWNATPRTQASGPHNISRRPADDLRAELEEVRERIRGYPDHLVDQLHVAHSEHAEAQRTAADARIRISELEPPPGRLLRRSSLDPAALSVERERLKLAERQAAAAAKREHELASRVPDRAAMVYAERSGLRERATALEAQLALCGHKHVRDQVQCPGRHLVAALGEFPNQPRAQGTWQQAAQRIEGYRFDHAITDPHQALGPQPAGRARTPRLA